MDDSRRPSNQSFHSMETRSQSRSSENPIELANTKPNAPRTPAQHRHRRTNEQLREDIMRAQLSAAMAELELIKQKQRRGKSQASRAVVPPTPAAETSSALASAICMPLLAISWILKWIARIICSFVVLYVVLILASVCLALCVIFPPFALVLMFGISWICVFAVPVLLLLWLSSRPGRSVQIVEAQR